MSKSNAIAGTGMFETTFLLFFLAIDLGQGLLNGSIDTLALGIAVAAVAILPYFLPTAGDIGLTEWLTGRGSITLLGLVLGLAFGQIVGVLIPGYFSVVPLMAATVAACVSCFMLFANHFRLGFAD